jgi:hypothetical protein
MKDEDLYAYLEKMYDDEYGNLERNFEIDKSEGSTDLDNSVL